MKEEILLNRPQASSVILNPKSKVDIWGRGTGKSFLVGWDINMVNRLMPRALTAVTGQTYGQLLTRTLPSTFKFLEKLGYIKDKNYVIGRRPPRGFLDPYEKLMKYDNVISFSNGNAILMLSQDRAGSARGPNVDYEIADEALTLNKERYDEETSPTNRGNEELWGRRSKNPLTWHHGFHYVSSMPHSIEQKWLTDYGNYYEEEFGILLFSTWNRIVNLQMELIPAFYAKDVKTFQGILGEVRRLRRQILPAVSREGMLFTLANAFDNIENVGMSYIIREYEKQTNLTFLVEIMNMYLEKVEDCYYQLDERKHVYFSASNDDYIRGVAEDTNWNFTSMESVGSRGDADCDPSAPLEISPDWGSKICLLSIGQERNFDFVTRLVQPTDNFINEFFVKPDTSKTVMINELIEQFTTYYRNHIDKTLFFYRDRYGDARNPSAKNSRSYNEQAISCLEKAGWTVISRTHRGMEPPQHDKYLLWSNILKGTDPIYPLIRFNGQRCKYTMVSMNNTRVIDKDGKFTKDKRSERNSSILPEEATHFSDAIDKRIWTKYGDRLMRGSTFIPARL